MEKPTPVESSAHQEKRKYLFERFNKAAHCVRTMSYIFQNHLPDLSDETIANWIENTTGTLNTIKKLHKEAQEFLFVREGEKKKK